MTDNHCLTTQHLPEFLKTVKFSDNKLFDPTGVFSGFHIGLIGLIKLAE